jgi:hypothetical protein
MPRKKKPAAVEAAATLTIDAAEAATAVAVAEPEPRDDRQEQSPPFIERPAWIDGPPTTEAGRSPLVDHEERQEPPRNWGDPYKSIFSCPEQGFELGEHRRFKQRVFRFAERPNPELLAELKELGFTYRAAEKAWTTPADPASRKMTDELARKWAGPNYVQGAER